jgi:hypothetical protein
MKKLKLLIIVLISFAVILALVYSSGILVKPNFLTSSRLLEVDNYDVLTWQSNQEQIILDDYLSDSYTMAKPYIILDPYQMNPLSALVLFDAETDGEYKVSVVAENDYATLDTYFSFKKGRVEIPVIGLFPEKNNTIIIKNEEQTVTLNIETEPLPQDSQTIQLISSQVKEMEAGFTLFIACFNHSYTAVLDQDGAVRAYFSNQEMAHGSPIILLQNGHLISTGDETKQVPYNMTSLWEFNWLGKIYREIEIPNGVHHDLSELPNGDFLAVSNNVNMFETGTREDVVIIIDRNTGLVKTTYDFRTILDETRNPFNSFHPNILNALNVDWMHVNGAILDQEHNWLIVSSPIQSEIVAIDAETQEIQWILGPHEGYEGNSAYLSKYLLTPIGENFEWQWAQHHPMLLPDFDNNPDTLDILMLDNGQVKSFTEENAVSPENNTSRAVHFRIHLSDKTVEQVWEYGKERGNELYATFLGDANYMNTSGNTLITFGGQLKQNGITVDRIVDGVLGNVVINSTIVEVNPQNKVVFEVKIVSNDKTTSAETYQAHRIDFSSFSTTSILGVIKPERSGVFQYSTGDNITFIPNLYFGDLEATFNTLINENERLIIDGTLRYNDETYLLAQAVIVLRSFEKTYTFKSNSGLNGRFFSSIDLTSLNKGVYEISIAGGIREGNDVLNGKIHKGYFTTHYKIEIN